MYLPRFAMEATPCGSDMLCHCVPVNEGVDIIRLWLLEKGFVVSNVEEDCSHGGTASTLASFVFVHYIYEIVVEARPS